MKSMSPALTQYYDRVENGADKPFESYLGKKTIRESTPKVDNRNQYRKLLEDDLGGKICGSRYMMDALKILFACQYSSNREQNSTNAYSLKSFKNSLGMAAYNVNGIKTAKTLSIYIFKNFIEGKQSKTHSPFLSMYKSIRQMEIKLLPEYYFDDFDNGLITDWKSCKTAFDKLVCDFIFKHGAITSREAHFYTEMSRLIFSFEDKRVYQGTVTVSGFVQRNVKFNKCRIVTQTDHYELTRVQFAAKIFELETAFKLDKIATNEKFDPLPTIKKQETSDDFVLYERTKKKTFTL